MSHAIVRHVGPIMESDPILAPPNAAAILASRCSDEQAHTHLGRLIGQRAEMALDREITLRRMIDAQREIARIDADREIEIARIERHARVRESRDQLSANIVHAVMACAMPRPVSRIRWREREGCGLFRSSDYEFNLEID